MKPPPTRAFLLNLESIALTDMVMNLFIFFFVSFSLLYTFGQGQAQQLEVTLPKAATGQQVSDSVVVVTITRAGKCYLGKRVIPESRLKPELEELANKRPGVAILVRADESAPCKALVAVFDAGRSAGVSRMNFAVQPSDGS